MATKFKGIKTAGQYQRGELTKDILRLIGAGIAAAGATVVAPNTLQLIEYFDPRSASERNKIWKAIKYLEERQRIRLEEREGSLYAVLTTHGRLQLDEDAIWELQIDTPRRWDRKWRLVMFDLPSKHEKIRQSFRHKLEDLGLKLYQRSVLIYPYECYQEIHTIASWYGVDVHVRYIVATEINDARRYVHAFDLV